MKPFTSRHSTQYLTKTSPLHKVDPNPKKDPNKFTRNYNAATGRTHEFIQDDGGNSVTPGYDFKKAKQYKENAIKKYGSLEASRKHYNNTSRDNYKR